MNKIKKFKLFESESRSKIDLGEIEDLVQMEILDEFDSKLVILSVGKEEEFLTSRGNLVKFTFPSSEYFTGYDFYLEKDEFGEFLYPKAARLQEKDVRSDIISMSGSSEFLFLIIDFPLNEAGNKFSEIYQNFRMVVKRISSMTGMSVYNISNSDFKNNSIMCHSSDIDIKYGEETNIDWISNNGNKSKNMVLRIYERGKNPTPQDYWDEFQEEPIVIFTLILK
jgi:hypothetical protein